MIIFIFLTKILLLKLISEILIILGLLLALFSCLKDIVDIVY